MELKKIYIFVLFSFSFLIHGSGQNSLQISSDFPGGNIVVNRIEKDTVWLKPDLSFTEGNWFYWYFKISGISGKTIHFRFDQNYSFFAKYGPAYSLNNDDTWKWYGENRIRNNSFSFSFSDKDTTAFFSIAFPYTEKHLYEFLDNVKDKELLKIDTLCISRENRVIEKITIPSLKKTDRKVLITARHHACEMMANYLLEGIMHSLLNDKNLQSLREHTEFLIIPFVDKDGVENGEQGKNRIPRDHNRDYNGVSIHPSTAALREIIPVWSENKLKFVLDIHCPWISGQYNEYIYLVGSENPEQEYKQMFFSQLLEQNASGELKFYHKDFLPFGKAWNSASNYSKGTSFNSWAALLDGVNISTTIEFPYSNASGIMVTKDNARIFGEVIAYSINEYFDLN